MIGLTQRSVSLTAVIDTTQLSGPGRQLVALVLALRDRGHSASVLTLCRVGRPPSPLVAHAEAHGIPVTVLEEHGPLDAAPWRALRTHLAAARPDIVQTHSYKATALVWGARRAGLRFGWVGCYHGHTTENLKVRLYHQLDRYLLRRADRIVVMAEAQRRGFLGVQDKLSVIHNAVLTPARESPPPDWLPVGTTPLIAYVGRLSPEKGVDLLLDALAMLHRETPDLRWQTVVVGEGPERARLEAQAVAAGLQTRVQFVGSTRDPWPVYRAAALVVLPSRSEGLPNVMLEAIAADRRVIATAVGAVPDVIGASQAATVIPSGSAAAIARAIRTGLTTADDDTARADRAALRARHSLDNRVATHLALYRGVLGARPHGA